MVPYSIFSVTLLLYFLSSPLTLNIYIFIEHNVKVGKGQVFVKGDRKDNEQYIHREFLSSGLQRLRIPGN